jgi:hypothetical protein
MSEQWVMDRTGHTTSTMLQRYRRAARTVAEAKMTTLTPLHLAIPEFAPFLKETKTATPAAPTADAPAQDQPGGSSGGTAARIDLRDLN